MIERNSLSVDDIYIYIYIYIYTVIHRLFHCITTHKRDAGIDTRLTLRQVDVLPITQKPIQRKRRNFNAYVSLLFCLHIYYRVFNSFEEICITQVATGNSFERILSSLVGVYMLLYIDRLFFCITTHQLVVGSLCFMAYQFYFKQFCLA